MTHASEGGWQVRAIYLGAFLVSMAVLLLQIALTRIFSFTIWYHFAYVTISVALLGYGASGALLSVAPRLSGRTPGATLPLWALLASLTTVAALVAIAVVPFHPFQLRAAPLRQVPLMLFFQVAVTTPFFFAGMAISVALKALSSRVGRFYFFDLLGAAAGCFLVVPAIWTLSTPGAAGFAAVLFAAAAAAFAVPAGTRHVRPLAAAGAAVALLAMEVPGRLPLRPSPEKFLHFLKADSYYNLDLGHWWTPIYRTDVYGFRDMEFTRRFSYAGWGISPAWKEEATKRGPRLRMIAHDGDACAVIYEFDGDLGKMEMFDHHIVRAPYTVVQRPSVLVIGVGGGMDIVNALRHGARHVTGIELDPVTVDIVARQQADFAGHLYQRPDVKVVAGEGRSTLRHGPERYDVIQLTGVDTMAALSTGAYVLSESYLYTAEAVVELFDHLTDDGLISVMVADFNEDHGFPRHTVRQMALYVEALRRRGIDDAARHVAVVASAEGTPQVVCLLKKRPFTPEQSARLREFVDAQGFHAWAIPGESLERLHSRYLRTPPPERAAFLARFPLRLDATTDDKPFFFNFYRWRSLGRSLGDIDVGHTLATAQIMLLAMLLTAVGLSTVFILGPLVLLGRRGLRTPGRLGLGVYFAGIGLGFIFLEISFVQRLVLFLGYPTYSLTVVLCTLLASSGIGSYLTARFGFVPSRALPWLFGVLLVAMGLHLFALPALFHSMLGSPLPLRIAATAAALFPLGLVLGTFFPLGIQMVRERAEGFVPWAWAVNGCASVVGTILSVILAMELGFQAVGMLALGAYGASLLAARALAAAPAP